MASSANRQKSQVRPPFFRRRLFLHLLPYPCARFLLVLLTSQLAEQQLAACFISQVTLTARLHACLPAALEEEAVQRVAAETAGRHLCPGWASYAIPTT
jgi:hypothetical protein